MEKSIFSVLLLLTLMSSCKSKSQKLSQTTQKTKVISTMRAPILKENFKTVIDGQETSLFTIKNTNQISATFTNYGQRLVSLEVPDKDGKLADVVLGFSSLQEYRDTKEKYFGATIGRYGNRIAKGKFNLDGQEYTLAQNNGENHLHGGVKGFESVVWKAEQIANNEITFTRTSPHMEEGYPGNLEVAVNYLLKDTNELVITYSAETDKNTVINLTHHSFFNLKGEGNGTINKHQLMINADYYTPVDATLIPTGEILKVQSNTPFDFRDSKAIGKDLETENEQLTFGNGYDHNFVLNDYPKNEEGLILAAKVFEPESGRIMEVFTNEPGIQFYGGNFLDGTVIGKSGKPYEFRGAFCLETQHFPDSPNRNNFPSTILIPEKTYRSVCVYKFSTI